MSRVKIVYSTLILSYLLTSHEIRYIARLYHCMFFVQQSLYNYYVTNSSLVSPLNGLNESCHYRFQESVYNI